MLVVVVIAAVVLVVLIVLIVVAMQGTVPALGELAVEIIQPRYTMAFPVNKQTDGGSRVSKEQGLTDDING